MMALGGQTFALMTGLMVMAGSLSAQEVIGRSMVEGRAVELLDNGTWAYMDDTEVEAGCAPLRDGISFCGANFGWDIVPGASADITAQYRFDDQTYGIIIVEGVGADQGVTVDFMREMVVELAAGRTGTTAANVPVFDVPDGVVDKVPVDTISYAISLSGAEFLFVNSIYVTNSISVQFVTYTFANEPTDRELEIHRGFTNLIRIAG